MVPVEVTGADVGTTVVQMVGLGNPEVLRQVKMVHLQARVMTALLTAALRCPGLELTLKVAAVVLSIQIMVKVATVSALSAKTETVDHKVTVMQETGVDIKGVIMVGKIHSQSLKNTRRVLSNACMELCQTALKTAQLLWIKNSRTPIESVVTMENTEVVTVTDVVHPRVEAKATEVTLQTIIMTKEAVIVAKLSHPDREITHLKP